jgi:serine phosphatase RsbU (regulator of sigma subunit)
MSVHRAGSSRSSPSPRSSGSRLASTLPGRAIVVGVGVKLAIVAVRLVRPDLPVLLEIVDSIAGLAIAAGAGYFLLRFFLLAKRRLLWRVRRKLILSYLLIGFVPAVLIATFFVLGALLLLFNFSSYLLQTEMASLGNRVRLAASLAAVEIHQQGRPDIADILERARRRAQPDSAGLSLAAVPVRCDPPGGTPAATADLEVGPWAHVDPPRSLPAWIGCNEFTGLLAYTGGSADSSATGAFLRAVAFPDRATPRFAVIADQPIDDQVKARLGDEIGVDVRSLTVVDTGPARPLPGRAGPASDGPPAAASAAMGPLSWVTFMDYRDWTSGMTGALLVSTQLNLQTIYARLSRPQGVVGDLPFGQALLVVLLVVVGGLFFVIEVVALVVGSALARSITGSVHELFTGTEHVRRGDFSHRIAVTAPDQLGELAGSFNSMTASIEGLMREAAEKKRLEEELRIAHEIQMSLLPNGPLTMHGLTATAVCIPAREVGGDYYDFLPLDDHSVGILIADVSGKGTSAALYMAQLKGLMLSLSTMYRSPRELLVAANRLMADHLDMRSFITVTYAVVDLRARTMTYARAGHTPLIYVPAAPARRHEPPPNGVAGEAPDGVQILAPDGMVVGLKLDGGEMFERLLEEQMLPLHAGDLYVFFTDGISEAMNAADECFGEVRLGRIVHDHAALEPDQLRGHVLREVTTFVNGAPQHDDMTMILLKVEDLPAGQEAAPADAGVVESWVDR